MQLSPRALNRTLLHRQGLLERSHAAPEALVERLVGLQAQEPLSPYLALAARIEGFDPRPVSAALADRRLVRMVVMRGTIHLLVPDDALTLRPWVQPRLDQERRQSQYVRPARHLARDDVRAAVAGALADGPLPQADLGARLADRLGELAAGVPEGALAQVARVDCALVQVPPRGRWRTPGGVVYALLDRYLGQDPGRPVGDLDVPGLVRRYLAAFGPASAADLTAWSGVTRLGPVLTGMADLERHTDEHGRVLYDVPGGEVLEDVPAPVRLLGTYDNVWLSHAARDRVTEPEKRRRWAGANGGVGCAVLVDGRLEGLWRVTEDRRPEVYEELRRLTRPERAALAEELDRVAELLAVPAG